MTNTDAIKPVAWLRWAKMSPITGETYEALWLTNEEDERGFPVFSSEQMEALEAERDELRAGIKRLSDEEELLAETSGDPISIVRMAAALSEYEKANVAYVDANTALIARVKQLEAERGRLREAAKPFTDEIVRTWVDEHGWTDIAPNRDRICDWFGPSDFRNLLEALTSKDHPHE